METKICPFCAEEIAVAAIKCKHCQSMLPQEPDNEVQTLENESEPAEIVNLEEFVTSLRNSEQEIAKSLFLLDDITSEILSKHKSRYANINPSEKPLVAVNNKLIGAAGKYGWSGMLITDSTIYYRLSEDSVVTNLICHSTTGAIDIRDIRSIEIEQGNKSLGAAYAGDRILINGEVIGLLRIGGGVAADEVMMGQLAAIFKLITDNSVATSDSMSALSSTTPDNKANHNGIAIIAWLSILFSIILFFQDLNSLTGASGEGVRARNVFSLLYKFSYYVPEWVSEGGVIVLLTLLTLKFRNHFFKDRCSLAVYIFYPILTIAAILILQDGFDFAAFYAIVVGCIGGYVGVNLLRGYTKTFGLGVLMLLSSVAEAFYEYFDVLEDLNLWVLLALLLTKIVFFYSVIRYFRCAGEFATPVDQSADSLKNVKPQRSWIYPLSYVYMALIVVCIYMASSETQFETEVTDDLINEMIGDEFTTQSGSLVFDKMTNELTDYSVSVYSNQADKYNDLLQPATYVITFEEAEKDDMGEVIRDEKGSVAKWVMLDNFVLEEPDVRGLINQCTDGKAELFSNGQIKCNRYDEYLHIIACFDVSDFVSIENESGYYTDYYYKAVKAWGLSRADMKFVEIPTDELYVEAEFL